ncbi:hypothetical protein Acr_28g0007000 [Actinidia rufa]|uniref:Late embryogenesis abundant (LEA) hydroxyproline-rich glycoprotein family n=1 Tax=Actinidia rufa TaxID=165716 RepID=A0A7J0HAJ4_9ERIC|nr:hypothetical protein Acr_28g0007000 [Actinidia rufa]
MPPLPKPPSHSESFQRPPSCCIYFSENPSKHDTHKDCGYGDSLKTPPRNHQTDGCTVEVQKNAVAADCAGPALPLVAGCIALVLVLLGTLSYSFVHGSLADFRIRSFNITKLEVSPKDKPITLTADAHFIINAMNKNHRFKLSYEPLNVDISAGKINQWHTKVAPFEQCGGNVRDLDLKVGDEGHGV